MHGMYLLVQPGGDSVLAVGFRHDGKPGTVALGVYPNVYRKDRANARKIAYLALRGRLPASWNSSDAGDQT
ncbi:DUF4102 domain-containing protein [Sphingomonas sp. ABOLD]|nr:DUF4102 domain-containing protein [Sphingomonas sp. ABOLE]RSV44179.1 DUF4102 domain-containing protein [Sphingomonas sp. ABOLD]